MRITFLDELKCAGTCPRRARDRAVGDARANDRVVRLRADAHADAPLQLAPDSPVHDVRSALQSALAKSASRPWSGRAKSPLLNNDRGQDAHASLRRSGRGARDAQPSNAPRDRVHDGCKRSSHRRHSALRCRMPDDLPPAHRAPDRETLLTDFDSHTSQANDQTRRPDHR